MARQMRMDPFGLYIALNREWDMDPVSKKIWNDVYRNDLDVLSHEKAVMAYDEFVESFTGEETEDEILADEIHEAKIEIDTEEISSALKKDKNISWGQIQAIRMSRMRVSSGIPWGTAAQMEKVSKEAWNLNSLEESKKFLTEIPLASKEWEVAIQIIARFFMRYPVD